MALAERVLLALLVFDEDGEGLLEGSEMVNATEREGHGLKVGNGLSVGAGTMHGPVGAQPPRLHSPTHVEPPATTVQGPPLMGWWTTPIFGWQVSSVQGLPSSTAACFS